MLRCIRLQRISLRTTEDYNKLPILVRNLYYQQQRGVQQLQQESEDSLNFSSANYCINLVKYVLPNFH